MKRITALAIALCTGGAVIMGFGIAGFVKNVPPGVGLSEYEIGMYLPGYTAIGIVAVILGIILLTAREHM